MKRVGALMTATMTAALCVAPAVQAGRSDVVARASHSVVVVEAGDHLGSAFAFGRRGRFLTNAHVVGSADAVTLRDTEGRGFDARVVTRDARTDVAVLTAADGSDVPLLEGGTVNVRPGDDVLAIGAPGGLGGTVTRGIVSAVERQVRGQSMIQTDVAVNPGNSGGPLLDQAGRVVGITTSKDADQEGIAFAIPIRAASTAASASPPPADDTGPASSLGWYAAAGLLAVGASGFAVSRSRRARAHPPIQPNPSTPRSDDEPLVVVRRRASHQTARRAVRNERSNRPWT